MSENRELTQRPQRRGPMGRGMQPGDVICWVYTCDLGQDVGGGAAVGE